MPEKTLFSHLFILRARFTPVAVRINADSTARSEFPPDLDVTGIHETDQIFHDFVYAVFMKISMISETEQIELEGF